MMNWNIRVMNCPSENGGEDLLSFKEVYYEEGRPVAYGDLFLCSETKEGLEETISRMRTALDHPTLHENQFGGAQ